LLGEEGWRRIGKVEAEVKVEGDRRKVEVEVKVEGGREPLEV